MKKLFSLKNIFTPEQKKSPPSHVKIDGHIYERHEVKTVNIEIKLDEDVSLVIEDMLAKGSYVSSGEIVRDLLRHAMQNKTLCE